MSDKANVQVHDSRRFWVCARCNRSLFPDVARQGDLSTLRYAVMILLSGLIEVGLRPAHMSALLAWQYRKQLQDETGIAHVCAADDAEATHAP